MASDKPIHQRPYGRYCYFQAAFGACLYAHDLFRFVDSFHKTSPYPTLTKPIDTQELTGNENLYLATALYAGAWIPDAIYYPIREYPAGVDPKTWDKATERQVTKGKRYDTQSEGIAREYEERAVDACRAALAKLEIVLPLPLSAKETKDVEGRLPPELELRFVAYVKERAVAFLEDPFYAYMVAHLADRIWSHKELDRGPAVQVLEGSQKVAASSFAIAKEERHFEYPTLFFPLRR